MYVKLHFGKKIPLTQAPPSLDIEGLEKLLEVAVVDVKQKLGGSFGGQRNIAFEGLEEAHFCHGVFLANRERAAVGVSPSLERGLLHENAQRKGGLAISRYGVDEFASGPTVVSDAIHFIETVLIHVAVCGGITFNSADSIGARHRRIIEGESRKVNATECEIQSGSEERETISEWNSCSASGQCKPTNER